jgi:CBS domain-containing protein/RNA polymerase-binding transcription factor DksA
MQTEVKGFMTGQPISIDAQASALQALDLMIDHSIRHLPVVGPDRRVHGVLSFDDLRAAMPVEISLRAPLGVEERWQAADISVGEVMTYAPVTIRYDASLQEAVARMIEGRFGCLPVVDERGRLDGILTETDLLHALATVLWSERERAVPKPRAENLLQDLERERDDLVKQLSRYEHREQEMTETRREIPLDLAEQGQVVEEGRLTEQLADLAARRLRAIEHALARAATGQLGICEGCGGRVSPPRLRALPGSTLCIGCAREAEIVR